MVVTVRKKILKKNIIVLFLSVILFFSKAEAQKFTATVQQQVQQNKLSQVDALFLQAVAMFAPEKLPSEYKKLNFEVQKCGFELQTQIKRNFKKFTPSQQRFLQNYLSRPDLPFTILSSDSLFRIHYAVFGSDAVPIEDIDQTGIPDYVEEVARAMEYNYQVEVLSIGLNPPPPDNKDGPQWDVYIKNIPNYYGYTSFDSKISSNPAVWTSYITIDNDYVHTPTTQLGGMKITTAHEFFHMIQLGYNFRFSDVFLLEVGAVWMEDVIYDEVNQYIDYLEEFFQTTNMPFNTIDGSYEYGLCIWFHFLEQRLQSMDFVADVWDYIVDFPAIQAVDRLLKDKGTNFQNELTLFYGWNYFTGSRADTLQYYPEGDIYPEFQDSDLDGIYTITRDTTVSDIVVPTGAKYYKFEVTDGTSLTIMPVNTDTVGYYNANKEFSINFTRDMNSIYQYYLTNGIYFNLLSEAGGIIKGTAFIQNSDNSGRVLFLDAVSPDLFKAEGIPECYPNPFILEEHSFVSIPFEMEQSDQVRIKIITPSGYLVWEDRASFTGPTIFKWDGRTVQGQEVSGGIYIYIISSGDKVLRQGKIAVIN